ncbi:MAG: class I SAM-dependent methyltransferase [Promethearchaeota archaeon]
MNKMEELPKGLANSGAIEIAKKLESISGGKILDVATQSGGFINTLMKTLKNFDSFIGIDILFKDVESLEKEFENKPVEFVEMNAETLNFVDNSFDTVTISHSIHHLMEKEMVLSEMKRVLKPDGHFIIQEPFSDGEQSAAQHSDILQHHWGAKIDKLLNIPHRNTFTRTEIEEIIAELRLRDLAVIESTHYVKCLFCNDKFECEDPKNERIIKFIISEIDSDLERLIKIKDHPEFEELKEEGERLKERVQRIGSASASHLFIIGKK